MQYLIFGVLALLGLNLIRQEAAANALVFDFSGLSFSGGIINPILTVRIQAMNNTRAAINLQHMGGELFVNDTKVGNMLLLRPTVIQPENFTILEFQIRDIGINILPVIQNIISSRNYTASFKGRINSNGVSFPVEFAKVI